MKQLEQESLSMINGGNKELAVAGGITCALTFLSFATPFAAAGVAMFGPSCFGSVLGMILD